MLSDYQKYRLFEILPGLSIWLTLFFGVLFSFLKPLWVIYFIILFDIYWVLKVLNFSFYLFVAWRRMTATKKINWQEKLEKEVGDWDGIKHIIFLTVYNEDWDVVQTAIDSVAGGVYKRNNFILVVAGEERNSEHCINIFELTKKFFGNTFFDIVYTSHPVNLPDEIMGKGSNMNFSGREMQKYVDAKGWNYSKTVATVFDIDTVCHPQYFSYLTYLYTTHPNPTKSSFQPVALYNNNIWESPSILRIMAFGTTFWLMTSLARQDALVTFSSHSMSFRALVDAGFHDKRIVSEDSRIFYQCLLAYNGNYRVTPMYLPVSMDTVRDNNWWQSVKNLYRQQRRWAWGVEHIPYLLWEFGKNKKIKFWQKFKWVFIEWEGKWSWCLVALMITFFPRLPVWFASDAVAQSALFFNAPYLVQFIITTAMVGLLLSALLSFPLLPKRPKSHPVHVYITMVLQWALLPVSLVFVSSIPAIDAVSHLMFGKYLGFNISQKKRGK